MLDWTQNCFVFVINISGKGFAFLKKATGKNCRDNIYMYIYICQIIKAKISPTMTGGINDL